MKQIKNGDFFSHKCFAYSKDYAVVTLSAIFEHCLRKVNVQQHIRELLEENLSGLN